MRTNQRILEEKKQASGGRRRKEAGGVMSIPDYQITTGSIIFPNEYLVLEYQGVKQPVENQNSK